MFGIENAHIIVLNLRLKKDQAIRSSDFRPYYVSTSLVYVAPTARKAKAYN
eukprot:IDg10912t1